MRKALLKNITLLTALIWSSIGISVAHSSVSTSVVQQELTKIAVEVSPNCNSEISTQILERNTHNTSNEHADAAVEIDLEEDDFFSSKKNKQAKFGSVFISNSMELGQILSDTKLPFSSITEFPNIAANWMLQVLFAVFQI